MVQQAGQCDSSIKGGHEHGLSWGGVAMVSMEKKPLVGHLDVDWGKVACLNLTAKLFFFFFNS